MTSGRSAGSLVEDVLAAMEESSSGSQDALKKLKDQSGEGGDATEEKKTPEKPPLTVAKTEVMRPNGEKYYVRKLGKHHDVAVLRKARLTGVNPLLTGPPGTGKTALLEAAYCEDNEGKATRIYTVQGSGDTETADFVGGFVERIDPETGRPRFDWVHGPLLLAMMEGAVLYVDEVALIDPKVMAIVYGVMDGRGVIRVTANPDLGEIEAQPGFFVVAACNPYAPGARMSEALLSRFDLQFEVTTDYVLAGKLGVDKRMITAASNMQTKVNENVMDWAPQLRELLAFKKICDEFDLEMALRNMVMTAPDISRNQAADIISRNFHQAVKKLTVN